MAYRYKTIKVGGKTKLLHRHLAEQAIGRRLSVDEHVHHADEDRRNNSDGNLEVLPAEVHRQHHADERLIYPRQKLCAICRAIFEPAPTKRKRQKTCSPGCANALRSRTEKETKARAIVAANYSDATLERIAA